MTTVMILGAGFGGLELATRLSNDMADRVQVTLIDQSDAFMFGYSKLDVMYGRESLDAVQLPYSGFDKPSVEFRQETVVAIDPSARRVTTNRATYEPDILVIALGADLDPSATPGLVESGFEFYSPEGAVRVKTALDSFTAGDIVISVLGGFFKCPPAPNEMAFMLHDHLITRGVRDACTITLTTPLPKPIPVDDAVSTAIVEMLTDRGVHYRPNTLVTEYDAADRRVRTAAGEDLPCDLFLAVPIHKAPDVVVESGVTEPDGWIAVDHRTFATKFPGVYAVGDITSAPVPRAGAIAEGEAGTVADVLFAELGGGPAASPYAGEAVCYIEMGDGTIGKVDVNFLGGPAPTAAFSPPTLANAAEKQRFGASRRARWFGLTT